MLAPSFVARLAALKISASPAIDSALVALAAAARTAWPRIDLSDDQFADFLATHLSAELRNEADVVRAIEAFVLHAADLWLACGCADGKSEALAVFERTHLSQVGAFVARVDSSTEFADEVKQILRERLLMASRERSARIRDYSGAGALGAWLRVAAVRTARNLQRDRAAANARRPTPTNERDDSPEIAYLKARYGKEMAAAFQHVLSKLPSKDKSLLMMHFVDGQSTTAIAAVHRVHPATVRRWIEQLRSDILAEARRDLQRRLGSDQTAVTSLMDLVQSQLDLSLVRVLRG